MAVDVRKLDMNLISNLITCFCILFFAGLVNAQSIFKPPQFLIDIQNEVLRDPAFNKSYLKNGCHVRAHWIAALVAKKANPVYKVLLTSGTRGQKLNMQVTDQDPQLHWDYHVAAAFHEEVTDEVWVLDPTLSKKVLALQDWLKIFQAQNPGVLLVSQILDPEFYTTHPDTRTEWERLVRQGAFSQDAMDYIREAMEDLFYWETFEKPSF